jgi:hypothetical protein
MQQGVLVKRACQRSGRRVQSTAQGALCGLKLHAGNSSIWFANLNRQDIKHNMRRQWCNHTLSPQHTDIAHVCTKAMGLGQRHIPHGTKSRCRMCQRWRGQMPGTHGPPISTGTSSSMAATLVAVLNRACTVHHDHGVESARQRGECVQPLVLLLCITSAVRLSLGWHGHGGRPQHRAGITVCTVLEASDGYRIRLLALSELTPGSQIASSGVASAFTLPNRPPRFSVSS